MKNLIAILSIALTVGACAKQGATTNYGRIVAQNESRTIYDRDVVAEIIVKDQIKRELGAE